VTREAKKLDPAENISANSIRSSGSCRVNIRNYSNIYNLYLYFNIIPYFLADEHDYEASRAANAKRKRDARGGKTFIYLIEIQNLFIRR
jgi:hypothetical protein